jgi:hypothetical protein
MAQSESAKSGWFDSLLGTARDNRTIESGVGLVLSPLAIYMTVWFCKGSMPPAMTFMCGFIASPGAWLVWMVVPAKDYLIPKFLKWGTFVYGLVMWLLLWLFCNRMSGGGILYAAWPAIIGTLTFTLTHTSWWGTWKTAAS